MIKVTFAGLSDRGKVRPDNQDNWFAKPEEGLFGVSDGMGGRHAGAMASRIVVETLPKLLTRALSGVTNLAQPDVAEKVLATFTQLSDEIRQRSKDRPGLDGMGATVVASVVRGGRVLVAHMGDSRAYLLRHGQLRQVTRDHTVVQLLIDAGEIRPEDAAEHPARAKLSRFVGMPGESVPDADWCDHLHAGDRLLLCTDGLTSMVSDQLISEILNAHERPDQACSELVSAANHAGGKDNITTIVIRLDEAKDKERLDESPGQSISPKSPNHLPRGIADGGASRGAVVKTGEGKGGQEASAREYSLIQITTIGRDADNDIVLDYPMISGHHARLVPLDDQVVLEDLGSSNGTCLESQEGEVTTAVLLEKDTVYFGSYRISVRRLLKLANESRQGRNLLTVADHPLVLGRDPQSDYIIDHPQVSWQHARISRSGENLLVEDLGSTNGTFVNGQRVADSPVVRSGDVISLGTYSLTLGDGGRFTTRNLSGDVAIEVRNLAVDVPGKRLLDGVSLVILPSEFVGLMGPSGAGKSTLINAMNGYSPPTAGKVLLAGQDLYKHYDQFRGQIGYVPQDDIIHSDLTVGQALYYTARLRLPEDFSDSDIGRRITDVLKQLGLEGTKNVLIGSPEKKGISGGERKRANLAMELLTDPSVLFLDEPTSGLSSEDALMVMKVLRTLADNGKTILLTIHQPNLEAFRLMDNLVLVAKDQGSSQPGRLAYYGPAYPESVNFFNPDGIPGQQPGTDPLPDEVLRGLAKQPTDQWVDCYKASRYRREYVEDRHGSVKAAAKSTAKPHISHSLDVLQAWTLLRRCVAMKLKDTWNTALLMVQAPIIGMLIVIVFRKETTQAITPTSWPAVAMGVSTAVFLVALSAIWFGCSNSAREIVAEWAIYRRERMVNLKIPSYVFSKFAVLGGLCVIQCAVLLAIVHSGCDLKGSFAAMFGILLLGSAVGVGVGLTISAIARTSEVAITCLPIIILVMVILGGFVQPAHNMALCELMPSRWAFEALLLVEAKQQPEQPMPVGPLRSQPPLGDLQHEPQTSSPRDIAEKFFPAESERMGVLSSIFALTTMLIVLVGSVAVILRKRDIH